MPVIEYPNWLRKSLFAMAVIHDLAIAAAGFIVVVGHDDIPLTLTHALDHTTIFWGALMLVGGLTSFVGSIIKQQRLECTGCVVTAAAKLVWVVAALQPGSGLPGTEILALILVAGASGTMWRFFGLWVGYYLRVRE
jgi:hypothetical protein